MREKTSVKMYLAATRQSIICGIVEKRRMQEERQAGCGYSSTLADVNEKLEAMENGIFTESSMLVKKKTSRTRLALMIGTVTF